MYNWYTRGSISVGYLVVQEPLPSVRHAGAKPLDPIYSYEQLDSGAKLLAGGDAGGPALARSKAARNTVNTSYDISPFTSSVSITQDTQEGSESCAVFSQPSSPSLHVELPSPTHATGRGGGTCYCSVGYRIESFVYRTIELPIYSIERDLPSTSSLSYPSHMLTPNESFGRVKSKSCRLFCLSVSHRISKLTSRRRNRIDYFFFLMYRIV